MTLYHVGQMTKKGGRRGHSHALAVGGWAACSILTVPQKRYWGTVEDITCSLCRKYINGSCGWELATRDES